MTLDWLIIGGGIHGTHIATRLIQDANVPQSKIKLIDPSKTLLAKWKSYTSATGMSYLRSPAVHHTGINPNSLKKFAIKQGKDGRFAPPFERPSLSIFNDYS